MRFVLTLYLDVWKDGDYYTQIVPSYLTPQMKKIVSSTVYGFTVNSIKLIGDGRVLFDVTLNKEGRALYLRDVPPKQQLKKIIEMLWDNYGDGAADGWMEGDIRFDYYKDGFYELVPGLTEVKVVQL